MIVSSKTPAIVADVHTLENNQKTEFVVNGSFYVVLEHFHIINSTQTYLKESNLVNLNSNTGLPKLSVVSAAHQTQGRGKGDRKWFSDEQSKCLAMSFGFLVSESRLRDCPILTQLLALAVVNIFPNLPFLMKWPNDLIIGGKKVGGILAELEPMNNDSYAVILGIGLNLDIDQSRLDAIQSRWPATSIARFCDPAITIDFYEIRDKIVQNFSKFLSIFLSGNEAELTSLIDEISSRQFLLNHPIVFRDGQNYVRGIHAGINRHGGLTISSYPNTTTVHYSGEIVLETVP